MKYKLIIDISVWSSFENIAKYYLDKNPNYITKVYESLLNHFKYIANNPFMYQELDYNPRYRFATILKKYILVYTIKENVVEILLFADAKTDYPNMLK